MSSQLLADLEAELEWRQARNLTESAERTTNEVRITRLDRLIGDARRGQAAAARSSPIPLIIVLVSFTVVGVLVGFFVPPSQPRFPVHTIPK